MLVNEARDVVDLSVNDHPEIISVSVSGDLLEGEGLLGLNGSLSGSSGSGHCVREIEGGGNNETNRGEEPHKRCR